MKEFIMCRYQHAVEILEKLRALNPSRNYSDYINKYRSKIEELEND